MNPFILNLLAAVLWLFLGQERNLMTFLLGFLLGFVILALFRQILGSGGYVRKTFGFVVFLVMFIREFLNSNFTLMWAILTRRREDIHPNFITYDISGLTEGEILFLSQCISLTPGTTSVKVLTDSQELIIHAFDADNPNEVREGIDKNLKKYILGFTR